MSNVEVVKRWFEIYESGNLAELPTVLARGLVSHNAIPGLPPGMKGLKMAYSTFKSTFPDGRNKLDAVVAEGDKVGLIYTFTGTHKGEFFGMPPTGKRVKIQSVSIFRLRNGKIVEHWGVNDAESLMQQLGAGGH